MLPRTCVLFCFLCSYSIWFLRLTTTGELVSWRSIRSRKSTNCVFRLLCIVTYGRCIVGTMKIWTNSLGLALQECWRWLRVHIIDTNLQLYSQLPLKPCAVSKWEYVFAKNWCNFMAFCFSPAFNMRKLFYAKLSTTIVWFQAKRVMFGRDTFILIWKTPVKICLHAHRQHVCWSLTTLHSQLWDCIWSSNSMVCVVVNSGSIVWYKHAVVSVRPTEKERP